MNFSKNTDKLLRVKEDFKKKGWISDDPEVLNLLKDGYETFEINTARRIQRENPGKITFNTCPICGALARTPQARQCRNGHSWREQS